MAVRTGDWWAGFYAGVYLTVMVPVVLLAVVYMGVHVVKLFWNN